MIERTRYARSLESKAREEAMRKEAAPFALKNLGQIISDRTVKGMQLVTVRPPSGPPFVAWVKCAWKPGTSGNCAVQMAFPGKEGRPHTPDDAVRIVTEVAQRASARGATHLLLLAADNEGRVPTAAYMLPIAQVGEVFRQAIAMDESLIRNGASPSLYVAARDERQAALVDIVRAASIDLLELDRNWEFPQDAIEDLNGWPVGVSTPKKTYRMSPSYARDPKIRSCVLNRARGRCEYCGELGFLMSDGKRHYLEAHHIISLADEGRDTVDNVIALCPKHHREAHFGANRTSLEDAMTNLLRGSGRRGGP